MFISLQTLKQLFPYEQQGGSIEFLTRKYQLQALLVLPGEKGKDQFISLQRDSAVVQWGYFIFNGISEPFSLFPRQKARYILRSFL